MNVEEALRQLNAIAGPGTSVIAALSGGVDSAVAAWLLQKAGMRVIGVTTKNFCFGDVDLPARSCCSIESIEDAKRICSALDVNHMVLDAEDLFKREVIDNFVEEYAHSRTPNPCVRCNIAVRFHVLSALAGKLGAEFIATGHYAGIQRRRPGKALITRGTDRIKDQSYFLSGLNGPLLDRIIFPLGGFTKKEVRKIAGDAHLPVAEKAESQEVCFMPEGDLKSFLSEHIVFDPGPIVDTEGSVIGRHEGLHAYTIGQRKGLGVYGAEPSYVIRIDGEKNRLIVGGSEHLYGRRLLCEFVWIDGGFGDVEKETVLIGPDTCAAWERTEEVTAQIRSRHHAGGVERIALWGSKCEITFEESQRAICPGQTVALYRGAAVVGSGTIIKTLGSADNAN